MVLMVILAIISMYDWSLIDTGKPVSFTTATMAPAAIFEVLLTLQTFACLNSTLETLEKGVKYVQS